MWIVTIWWNSCRRFHWRYTSLRQCSLEGCFSLQMLYNSCSGRCHLRKEIVVLLPSLSILPLVCCQLLSSEVVVSVFFELCSVIFGFDWWCDPIRCLVVCWVIQWIWRAFYLSVHRLVTWFIICLNVCGMQGYRSFSVGMLYFGRLAEHYVAGQRKKSLVSALIS